MTEAAKKREPVIAYDPHDAEDGDWIHVCSELTTLMKKNDAWYATVENFGWRKLNGQKHFIAKDGQSFLRELLPQTQCTFKVFKGEGEWLFEIQNWHHDSPAGDEWYRVKKARMRSRGEA